MTLIKEIFPDLSKKYLKYYRHYPNINLEVFMIKKNHYLIYC